MADTTESSGELVKVESDVEVNSTLSPEFIQELLPSAERTALLYNLSYLSLGAFPNLECQIRDQAIETQLLFGSSEAVLLKCVGTCSNLVTSLFPMLRNAVVKNKPVLAVKYLSKAKEWINDVIVKVDDIVKRYYAHNRSLKACTSGVFKEQKATEQIKEKQSDEMNGLEAALEKFEKDLKIKLQEIETNERQIQVKHVEFKDFLVSFQEENSHWTRKFIHFFSGYPNAMRDPIAIAINAQLNQLNSENSSLKNDEWNIKIKQTDLQLQMANCKIRMGVIPDPDNLKEVFLCLSRIQQILVELKKFWEKVDAILSILKDKTFVNEELVDMGDMKEEFLISIEDAAKYWVLFGNSCQRAHGVFSVQSRDAYKFLEINPSSLTEEERKMQHVSIMEKLEKIHPQCSSKPAITE